MTPNDLRKLADRDDPADFPQLLDAIHEAADEIERLKDDLAEKKDIDELVAASVVRQESEAFAAEYLKAREEVSRLKDALARADERAVRWEDKVQAYGLELSWFKDELKAARKVVEAARTLRENYGGEARDEDLEALDTALAAYDQCLVDTTIAEHQDVLDELAKHGD